jgi:hypothetical protein
MEFKFRLTRKRTAAIIVIAALSAVGISYAAIPDASGTYYACKLRGTGTIRMIDESLPSTSLLSKCTAYEDEISWDKSAAAFVLGPDAVESFHVKNGTLTADDLGTWAVGNDEIAGDAVTSDKIAGNTVTADDLGTNAAGNDEIAGNAVTSEKVADNTLTADDLSTGAAGPDEIAAGAVTTSRQTANTAGSLPASGLFSVPADSPWEGSVSSSVTLVNPDSTSHRVLLTGQAVFNCISCGLAELIDVNAQVFDGASPVSGEAAGGVSDTDSTTTLPVLAVVSAPPGTTTYSMKLSGSALPGVLSANRTIEYRDATLVATDLGR